MNNYEEQLLQEQQELHQVHHAEEEPQLLQPPTHQEKQVPPHMELEEQEAIKYSIEDDGLEGFRTYIDNNVEWNSAKEETFMEEDDDTADHELTIDFE